MSFNDNISLDSSRIRDSRGGGGVGRGGGVAIGGGAGLLVLLLSIFAPGLAEDLGLTGGTQTRTQQQPSGPQAIDECQTGADANERIDCRILATVESGDAFWKPYLAGYQVQWREPGVELFAGRVNTACGAATSDVGPFYCPGDESMYYDTEFFDVLESRFGASGGPLAEEYVVAHEYGHHIQNIVGYLQYSQQGGTGPTSGAVRVELQADCYAGMWAGHAAQTKDPESGETFLQEVTETDLRDALSAAAAVGDDRIQQASTGRVMPEAFTHGTSEQRMKWFMHGYQTADINQCNTLDHPNLDQP